VQVLMWIAIGIVAGLAFLVLVPVLVLGTWFVVMTVTVGLADGAIWLLDQRWRRTRNRDSRPDVNAVPLGLPDCGRREEAPILG
jgi:hypothetical protein